jgi:3'(2'), 5'-bisphosphate nucleotidase
MPRGGVGDARLPFWHEKGGGGSRRRPDTVIASMPRSAQYRSELRSPLGEFAAAAELLGEVTEWSVRFAADLAAAPETRKADASPVTAADLAIQALLVVGLAEVDPGAAIVGEESTQVFRAPGGDALRRLVQEFARRARPSLTDAQIDRAIDAGASDGTADRQWVIDPIDGTRGYLRGQQYCTCLAYLEQGEVRFGAAGCPRLAPAEGGAFVAATVGGGAWRWSGLRPLGDPRRIAAASTRRDPFVACESPEVSSRAKRRLRILGETLAAPLVALPMESQCKFVLVATGEADLAIRFPPRDPAAGGADMVWDYAGAVLMVEEAGGRMTDCEGRTLRFGRGRSIEGNRGVLAGAAWLHGAVVGALPEASLRFDRCEPYRG